MKATLKFALVFLSLYILVKLLFFYFNLQYGETGKYTAFANLLFIILCIFFCLLETKRKAQAVPSTFLQDVKTGASTAIYYAAFVAIFAYVYYKFIDVDFFPSKINETIEAAGQGSEVDKEQAKQFAEAIFSPFNHATITLLGMMCAGVVFSFFVTFVIRKNPFNRKIAR